MNETPINAEAVLAYGHQPQRGAEALGAVEPTSQAFPSFPKDSQGFPTLLKKIIL
jgi:hypothetical protein